MRTTTCIQRLREVQRDILLLLDDEISDRVGECRLGIRPRLEQDAPRTRSWIEHRVNTGRLNATGTTIVTVFGCRERLQLAQGGWDRQPDAGDDGHCREAYRSLEAEFHTIRAGGDG